MTPDEKTKIIQVNYLARVEGEGAMFLKIRGNEVADIQLRIFEPPRFFEALLRGRSYTEAPDITARICGICPVAYQMSAVHAIENAFGLRVTGPLRDLRRLLYCGEWISSHTLHITMLHAPDFLGYESAVHMAKDHKEAVARGLQLKKTGNRILSLLGGREIHPINVRVGGFYKIPLKSELQALLPHLREARALAMAMIEWTAGFDYPDFEVDYEFVALRHPEEYPLNEGRITSNKTLDILPDAFETVIEESHVPHSTALHAAMKGRGSYFVGPMARYSLNFDRLPASIQAVAQSAGLVPVCCNPYRSILVRGLEVLYACEEALRIIEQYTPPPEPAMTVTPKASTGYACTEAPRGLLYHRYRTDENGLILEANIVPPTSQNQKRIEEDLRRYVAGSLELPDEQLKQHCEHAIRNYDPCISCSTHFLKLDVDRQP